MMKRLDNDTILKSTDPMQTTTTQKFDYRPHNVNRIAQHQPDKYVQPEGELETVSSYAREFNYKYQDKVAPIRHERPKEVLANFDPSTTNKSDYRPWAITKTNTFAPERRFKRPDETFAGASTYNNDFHMHQSQQARNLIKPIGNTQLSTDPFSDMTSNRQDFKRHVLPEKFVKPVLAYAPNKIPLDDMTTMKSDYSYKMQPGRMQSFKPVNNGVHSEEPFMATTTNKDDFQTWNQKPNFYKKDNQYVQPLGEMDMNTHYSRDFTGGQGQAAIAVRPAARKMNDCKFEGQTTYEMDFQKLAGGSRRGLIKGVSEYVLPDAKFDGQSTYMATHFGPQGLAAVTTKPRMVHEMPSDPFNADTSYRTEYTRKTK